MLRLAVDIGGTFTDIAACDDDGNIVGTTKTATTQEAPATGAIDGTRQVLSALGMGFGAIKTFIHGTTLATNALIERRGATVAVVASEGFRDILEIAYERRYSQYDIDIDKPDLLVPRRRCFTIAERMNAKGEVLIDLDEAAVDSLASRIEASGAEAVAICLLHAYANNTHEVRLGELLQEKLPHLSISLSSDISPEAREFERMCTTVANAYVRPLMEHYLNELERGLKNEGMVGAILMMTSGGGMTTIETAKRLPIRLVESGPSGGAVLAARIAAENNLGKVLSFDMGGTTAKLCLIDAFTPQTARTFEISRQARFIKGSGMPVRIPVIDMIEIGAGGGSIAAVDRLGRLNVGPESAGSDPGPAGFAKGGVHPTVTDADIVLGYIDPERFAEGQLPIEMDASKRAIQDQVGEPLTLNGPAAALGISQIVDESMASAGRMHAVESGKDLGARVMIAFGGNGPLHATRVARRSGVIRIVIPPDPGVGSAIGFLSAPVSFEIIRTHYTRLDRMDLHAVNALLGGMIEETRGLVRQGDKDTDPVIARLAFMRYHGQGHEIEIELPDRPLSVDDIDLLKHRFEDAYRAQFSRAVPGMGIEILNWAVRAEGKHYKLNPLIKRSKSPSESSDKTRLIRHDETGETINARMVDRSSLVAGDRVEGPALVIEPQTTTLVSADFVAVVDAASNLILTRNNGPRP